MRSTILKIMPACLLLLLSPSFAGAMTVYLSNDDEIDAETAWQDKGKVFVRVNKDLLLDFAPDEVDIGKTFPARAATQKKAGHKEKPSKKQAAMDAGQKSAIKPEPKAEPKAMAQQPEKGETLVVALPKEYRVDFQNRQGNIQMTEMVPEGQTVNTWKEMLTTQIFYGGVSLGSPEGFYKTMDSLWKKSCPKSEGKLIRSGEQDGYPYAFWMEFCPENPGTKQPEVTMFKAIKGKDSFYLVQKAWKYSPSKEEVSSWSSFMGKVRVYDSRIPAQSSLQTDKAK